MPHTDIVAGGWVAHVPPSVRPFLLLMRLDRPIGTWLLLLPGWWAIAMAEGPDAAERLRLMALFGIGAVLMRGAGCVVNDILDRDIDAAVERTRHRPLPSGAVSVGGAALFLALLLAASLLVLLQLQPAARWLGAASLLLVFPYPLMKRITWWPQLFLGFTFNWGALMGWAAATGGLQAPALLLYAGGIFWTLGYDTIYAHQDKADDVLVGVRSTALALGRASRRWVAGFYAAAFLLLAGAGAAAQLGSAFLAVLALAGLHLAWQARAWRPDDPADCLARFRSNKWFGLIVLAAIAAGRLAA
jgi:4-hydroxybenzoate polyprenyltransferase